MVDEIIMGYCMRCKAMVEMKDVLVGQAKTGVITRKGRCSVCDTNICKIGDKKPAKEPAKEPKTKKVKQPKVEA